MRRCCVEKALSQISTDAAETGFATGVMQYSSTPIFGGDNLQTHRETVRVVGIGDAVKLLQVVLIWRFIMQESETGGGRDVGDAYRQQVLYLCTTTLLSRL